jgi:hypothetical protein
MDTLKDKQWLDSLHDRGEAPWQLWTTNRDSSRELAHATG